MCMFIIYINVSLSIPPKRLFLPPAQQKIFGALDPQNYLSGTQPTTYRTWALANHSEGLLVHPFPWQLGFIQ